ncbi:hypothetical protein SORBI_3009G080100 [Sorghum bicolor]|uniref:Uncharacterized protein n=1 Tax=Sorghum bicolor TaxID=4558 RepID=A0A1B6P769_SORBI|nr:hypothetical protein SORBI_3009G080100 [Sorghum bicolor]OQU77619.1 hypothetical protein SORBI_3009G080100 [Sorghum bicolor]OQU77620.1 hypothetical protein SORBI_3009G080100 [Sorghum bicolor]OQU77621.1 hypothetical protein SORBI_3009G080100 [Sorghum bicolor]OQU77622.1 hypothetical protein SORBI_3009G080100 [Sorghum bicolor]
MWIWPRRPAHAWRRRRPRAALHPAFTTEETEGAAAYLALAESGPSSGGSWRRIRILERRSSVPIQTLEQSHPHVKSSSEHFKAKLVHIELLRFLLTSAAAARAFQG